MSDPTRREILDLLRARSQPVGRIAERFPVSRPAIYKHLQVLQEAALVTQRQQGRERLCELNAKPLRAVETWLAHYRQFWVGNLKSLKGYVEAQEQERK